MPLSDKLISLNFVILKHIINNLYATKFSLSFDE